MACNMGGEQYLTETYEEKVRSFVESNPELNVSYEEATEVFLDQCETFQELFQDETSTSAIQGQAYTQMKWTLENGK